MTPILALISAYLIGSVPFGYLVARTRGIDITKVGSGNIGATNVSRALGKGWALAVFLLDVGKGLGPALAGAALVPDQSRAFALAMGLAAVLGHTASPFLRFKGGKGVATSLGALLGSAPLVGASALGAFLLVGGLSRFVSLASIGAALSLVPLGLAFGEPAAVVAAYGALALFVLWRHRANIRRLREGTEPKFRLNSRAGDPQHSRQPPDASERRDRPATQGADAAGGLETR